MRREDPLLVTGRGAFVADLVRPDDLHLAFVRSPVAHGRITRVDTAEARRQPGVHGVWAATDLTDCGSLFPLTKPSDEFTEAYAFAMDTGGIESLASNDLTHVGQPIAVVAATSRALAEDAAELVVVDIASTEPTLDPSQSVATLRYEIGEYEALDSDVSVTVDLHVGRQSAVPIETRGVIARPTEHGVTVTTSTQIPHLVRRAIVEATGWPADSVVVEVPDVGGGFGCKANVYPEEIIIAVVARVSGRSVVWVEDRLEFFQAAAQGRDQRQRATMTVAPDGRIRRFELDYSIDLGSSSLWTAGMLANTAIHVLGPYRLPSVAVSGRAHRSHRSPTAQYRGAGRPEATFALERALDAAATATGVDRIDIRRRNLYDHDSLPATLPVPYRDGVPIVFDGRDWRAVYDRVVDLLPVDTDVTDELRSREVSGWGSSCFVEATGRGPFEDARVRLTPTGVVVATGAASAGQGHATTLALVAAEALRIPADDVTVTRTSTADIADGIGTFASRSAVVAGNAVFAAARRLRRDIVAATELADHEWNMHGESLSDGTRQYRVDELVELGVELDVVERYHPDTVTWTMGAHAAIVAVDVDTGNVRVVRYAVADEAGRSLDHDIVVGQIRGGVAQGIGGALFEACRYADDGQPIAVNFADYLIPCSLDVPDVTVTETHIPTDNPIGVRGVGESGAIGANAAIANAVDAALRRAGADLVPIGVTTTPIDPASVRTLLQRLRVGHR